MNRPARRRARRGAHILRSPRAPVLSRAPCAVGRAEPECRADTYTSRRRDTSTHHSHHRDGTHRGHRGTPSPSGNVETRGVRVVTRPLPDADGARINLL
jgi:hypothetical protein